MTVAAICVRLMFMAATVAPDPPSRRQPRVKAGENLTCPRGATARFDGVTAVPPRPRVLFVEDEASISGPFSRALAREGFEPIVAATAELALELAERMEPDIVLLDLTLPDGDGRDVCRALRRRSSVPILMLTARGTETDRIVGPRARRRRLRGQAVQRRRGDRPHPRGAAPDTGHAGGTPSARRPP